MFDRLRAPPGVEQNKARRDAAGTSRIRPSLAPRNRSPAITRRIVETYEECGAIHHLGHSPLPSYREVVDILADLQGDPLSRLRSAAEPAPRQRRLSRRRPDRQPARSPDAADRPRLPPRLQGSRPRDGLRGAGAGDRPSLPGHDPRAAAHAGRGRAGRLRRRPGRQEPGRDRLLLPRRGGGHRLSDGPRAPPPGRAR